MSDEEQVLAALERDLVSDHQESELQRFAIECRVCQRRAGELYVDIGPTWWTIAFRCVLCKQVEHLQVPQP